MLERPSVRPPVFCPVAAPERVSVQTAPSPPYRLSALAGSLARPIAVSLTGCGGDRDRSPARLLCIAHLSSLTDQSTSTPLQRCCFRWRRETQRGLPRVGRRYFHSLSPSTELGVRRSVRLRAGAPSALVPYIGRPSASASVRLQWTQRTRRLAERQEEIQGPLARSDSWLFLPSGIHPAHLPGSSVRGERSVRAGHCPATSFVLEVVAGAVRRRW